jgi:hypothetical protein
MKPALSWSTARAEIFDEAAFQGAGSGKLASAALDVGTATDLDGPTPPATQPLASSASMIMTRTSG